MKERDTIAAIASGMTSSGISVIRISGPEAFSVAKKIFKQKKNGVFTEWNCETMDSHTVHYGYIVCEEEIVDEVLVLLLRAPRTFTAEDTVEIQCHGGILVTRKVLQTVLTAGARLAEPGEFTKRAFLNGRIDLSQAEAVADVISAKNQLALKNSMNHLQGRISMKVRALREIILDEVSFIEAALDDPEHMELTGFPNRLKEESLKNIREIDRLLLTTEKGKYLSQGIRTVILGKPNVGKSSLLNAFLGTERAIVTDVAGTTRDTLTEEVQLGGITLQLVDTAGIRDAADRVEQIGVTLAKKEAKAADLILFVVDSSKELNENDYEILPFLRDKKAIVLLNKSDLKTVVGIDEISDILRENSCDAKVLSVSMKRPEDAELIEQEIKEMFFQGNLEVNDEVFITAERHREALQNAKQSLTEVLCSIEACMPEDFFSIDLLNAYRELGFIVGEEMDENLINNIFKKFCMGK